MKRRCYRIRNWERHFEKSQSRKVGKLTWVAMPNKHDGKGFRRLTRQPEAVSLFCAWFLLVEVASKMPIRGVLADEDGPLDAEDLSDKTGLPAEIFEVAFEVLARKEIGWLEVIDECDAQHGLTGHAADAETHGPGEDTVVVTTDEMTAKPSEGTFSVGIPASGSALGPTGQDRTGQDRTGHKRRKPPLNPPAGGADKSRFFIGSVLEDIFGEVVGRSERRSRGRAVSEFLRIGSDSGWDDETLGQTIHHRVGVYRSRYSDESANTVRGLLRQWSALENESSSIATTIKKYRASKETE